jgi:hypothetical protein
MSDESILAVFAATNLLGITTKQLEGDIGEAEEVTEEYRALLIAVLVAWVLENRNTRLEDLNAVNLAILELADQLEQIAIEELPVAFGMGSGEATPGIGEVIDLGGLVAENQSFLDGSFAPYMLEELAPTLNPFATIGSVAIDRQFAWENRIGLYAGAFWTAVWIGLGVELVNRLRADTQPVRRLLDPLAKHCPTCPPKAREYGSWNEMLAFTGGLPADGSDDCHSNCRCQIEVFDKGEWVSAGF